jgi:hypothetical protein
MTQIEAQETVGATDGHSTNLRRFIARRGSLIVKESHAIGRVEDNYGSQMHIATMVLRLVASTGGQLTDVTYGARLEQNDTEGNTDAAAYIDFEELDELIGAVEVIGDIGKKMPKPVADYTEVIYSTKDDVQFGFYAEGTKQTGFVKVTSLSNFFVAPEQLQHLGRLLAQSRTYLVGKGAGSTR